MRVLSFLKDYFLKSIGLLISLTILVLSYKFLGYDKFLELSRIYLWPVVVIMGMMFFRKVIFYLFFSLEEFNLFGNRGKLKDVRSLIEEKVLEKFQAVKEAEKRLIESETMKRQLESEQGNANKLYELATKAVKKNEELTLLIQEKDKKIETLDKVAIRVGQLVSVQDPKKESQMVCYVGDGVLLGIPDLAVFNSWGFSFAQILPANRIEKHLPFGGVIPLKSGNYSNPLDQISNTGITQPKE